MNFYMKIHFFTREKKINTSLDFQKEYYKFSMYHRVLNFIERLNSILPINISY